MSPAIRLGGEAAESWREPPVAARRHGRIGRDRVSVGGVPTRAVWSVGHGTPTVLLHGWMDNADTWLAVLERMAADRRPAIAYDLPGFGVTPALAPESVLDQLTDFAAAAVRRVAEASGCEVVVAGNSLGGWVALRLAARPDLPITGVVPVGPAGIRMAPLFFTIDRLPGVAQVIGMPAPVPAGVLRSIVAGLYRTLAYADAAAIDPAVVERFVRFNLDRATLRERINYAKRMRADLADPFDAKAIQAPVHAIWGELDRLCPVAGAAELSELLPDARVEVIRGVGHTPQIEATEAVVAAITDLSR